MKRLNYYIIRHQLSGILLALLAFCAFDTIADFISEAGKANDTYTLTDILRFIGLYMPYRINEFMPAAVLVGTIAGLGALSSNLEMIALRANGYSKLAILSPAMGAAALLALLAAMNAQWVIPQTLRIADAIEHNPGTEKITPRFWLRDNNRFISAMDAGNDEYLNAFVYEMSQDGFLQRVLYAKTMTVGDDTLTMHRVKQKAVGEDYVRITSGETVELKRTPVPIEMMLKNPEAGKMSAFELFEYIRFARNSRLNSEHYELALWQHIGHPLSVVILMLLAMPFVFSSSERQTGLGRRLFLGIMLGLFCHILSRTLSGFIMIWQGPAWLAVFLPLTILLSISLWRLYHCR